MAYIWKVLAVAVTAGWFIRCNFGPSDKVSKGYPDRSNMRKVW